MSDEPGSSTRMPAFVAAVALILLAAGAAVPLLRFLADRRRGSSRRPRRGFRVRTSGSLKTSSSSRLAVENSDTIAPSGPARNQCFVTGGIVLVARPEHDLVGDRVDAGGRSTGRLRRILALDVEVDAAPAAAERLLLSGVPSNDGWRCSGHVWPGRSTSPFAQWRSVLT